MTDNFVVVCLFWYGVSVTGCLRTMGRQSLPLARARTFPWRVSRRPKSSSREPTLLFSRTSSVQVSDSSFLFSPSDDEIPWLNTNFSRVSTSVRECSWLHCAFSTGSPHISFTAGYSSIFTKTLGLEKILIAFSISVSFRSSSVFLVFTRNVSTRTGRAFSSARSTTWSATKSKQTNSSQ